MTNVAPARLFATAAPVAAFVMMLVISCGTERPPVGDSDWTTPPSTGAFCGTPNEGCECSEPDLVVDCGKVSRQGPDGYVACTMGKRRCAGGVWSACMGETEVQTRSFVAGSPLHFNALGAGGPCPAGWNPCDPYCNMFADDPVGLDAGNDSGFVMSDGGLIIDPARLDGGSGGGGFTSTANGVSSCSPNRNVITATCATSPINYSECQQDHHCDVLTGTCLWNNGPGYFDPAAGGPDLTIGAPCGPQGSATSTAPVCNRGSANVPAGASIQIWRTTGPSAPNGCTNLGAPTFTFTLGSPLVPGACVSFALANSPGAKFVTINAGPSGGQPTPEANGRCANNSAYWRTDGSGGDCAACTACNTQITGTVYDPSASAPPSSLGNNIKLANVSVFQPSGALSTFAPLPACDTCASLASPAVTTAVTGADGSFVLNGVSPGTAVPIVVQSGRWRRRIDLNVVGCTNNTYPAGTFHLPKNRTDGAGSVADIPQIAISQDNYDPLECLVKKIGISDSEMLAGAGAHRIHLYRLNGMSTAAGTAPASSGLWDGTVNIKANYSAILFGCENQAMNAMTAASRGRLDDYANQGGRVFMTDLPSVTMLASGRPWNWAATGFPGGSVGVTVPASGRVETGTPAKDLFRDWMAANVAVPFFGAGFVRVDQPYYRFANVSPSAIEWIRGSRTNTWGSGDYVLSTSFETPQNGACGRVVYNAMHTSAARVAGGVPTNSSRKHPTDCNMGPGLTEEEKALEYQFFQLTACSVSTPPVVPPSPGNLPTVTFVRDYEGICAPDERPVWGPLYWQSVVPTGTSIDFRAATADTQAALPLSPPPTAPITRAIGSATTTVTSPAWDCDGCPGAPVTVDHHLKTDAPPPNTDSKRWLRVFMTFNPSGPVSPSLLSWRQVYSCVPAE